MSRVRRRPGRDERADVDDFEAFEAPPAAAAAAAAPAADDDRKPAKADDDIVAYVREMDMALHAAAEAVEAARAGGGSIKISSVLSPESTAAVSALFREVTRREASLATHKSGSATLEAALRCASLPQLVQVAQALHGYLPFLACNRFASHVCQRVLSVAVGYLTGQLEPDGADLNSLIQALGAWSESTVSHMSELIFNMCGAHVVRSLLQVGAGMDPLALDARTPLVSSNALETAVETCDRFYLRIGVGGAKRLVAIVMALGHALGDCDGDLNLQVDNSAAVSLSESSRFAMATDVHASPTLQQALRVTAISAPSTALYLNRRFAGVSLAELPVSTCNGAADLNRVEAVTAGVAPPPVKRSPVRSSGWFQVLSRHAIGARFAEALLVYADSELHSALGETVLADLDSMVRHGAGNYVVQRFAVTVRSMETAVRFVTQLEPQLRSLMDSNRDGVVWHMMATVTGETALIPNSALRLGPLPVEVQVRVVKRLVETAGNGRDPGHVARWWLDLNGYRSTSTAGSSSTSTAAPVSTSTAIVSPTGARILSLALRTTPTAAQPLLQSFLDLNPDELSALAQDPYVSRHVLELLVDSSPNALIKAFRGRFAPLAAGRFSSWLVSKLFSALPLKFKSAMAKELVEHEATVTASPSGRQVFKLARLELFKRNVDSWSSAWTRTAARVEALRDVMGDAAPTSTAAGRPAAGKQSRAEAGLETVQVVRKKRRSAAAAAVTEDDRSGAADLKMFE